MSTTNPPAIQLSATATPGFTHTSALAQESADKASELLTLNHSRHHVIWKVPLHNHITHHVLAQWALGASPREMQELWEYNVTYQAPIESDVHSSDNLDLADPEIFAQCLGDNTRYTDFLRFFDRTIAARGIKEVIEEYVLNGSPRADDIFGRLFSGLVHPMIHLGCGLEFSQPALIAEALAMSCVHGNWPKDILLTAESHARKIEDTETSSLLSILESFRGDPVITTGVKASDGFDKITDGLVKRVKASHFAPHLSRFRVQPSPEDLQYKLNEMMYTCAYFMGAAQHPGKRETLDFVLLHAVTLAVFYPAILALDWLSDANKSRLLEAKARIDAVLYAGCGSPPLYPERIHDYVPQRPQDDWPALFRRAIVYRDEGHVAKLIRALYSVEQLGEVCVPHFPIQKKHLIKIAHMALDSAERAERPGGHQLPETVVQDVASRMGFGSEMVTDNMKRYVFYGGLEGSWAFIPSLNDAIG